MHLTPDTMSNISASSPGASCACSFAYHWTASRSSASHSSASHSSASHSSASHSSGPPGGMSLVHLPSNDFHDEPPPPPYTASCCSGVSVSSSAPSALPYIASPSSSSASASSAAVSSSAPAKNNIDRFAVAQYFPIPLTIGEAAAHQTIQMLKHYTIKEIVAVLMDSKLVNITGGVLRDTRLHIAQRAEYEKRHKVDLYGYHSTDGRHLHAFVVPNDIDCVIKNPNPKNFNVNIHTWESNCPRSN